MRTHAHTRASTHKMARRCGTRTARSDPPAAGSVVTAALILAVGRTVADGHVTFAEVPGLANRLLGCWPAPPVSASASPAGP